MLGQERPEAFLRIVVFGLAQQVEGVFVLRLDRIAGQRNGPPAGAAAAGAGWTFADCNWFWVSVPKVEGGDDCFKG